MSQTYGVVNIDLRPDGTLLVHVMARTTEGAMILSGLPKVLTDADDDISLGQTVMAATDEAVSTVLPARDLRHNPPDAELLEWLKLPSYAAYAKGVREVKVHGFYEAGALTHVLVTPAHNGGARSGFTPLTDHRVRLDSPTAAQLGAAVQEAFALATL
ncbi:hypothetical protein MTE01_33920 [Microbacterium testaceum]|uniref:Uncharacterized protein n=1 Tax=Microbacterium testaceum TaxID=2033 RepID=A0A4Y3QRV2_MICTE|nr:hypothetical protein [Microbacterium testaceum]GEB47447.1 hypothetical protein MTE01_33920 [Microbacterium testaceum]